MTKIELQNLVEELKAKLADKKPVCPFCQTEMIPTKFVGYYDKFDYWQCACEEDFPVKEKHRGQYA